MTPAERLVLWIPLLLEEPMIGSGCCAVPAEEIVRDELERLPGVWAARFDESVWLVEACYDPGKLEAEKIIQTLARIGYPAVDPSEVDGKATQRLPKEANT